MSQMTSFHDLPTPKHCCSEVKARLQARAPAAPLASHAALAVLGDGSAVALPKSPKLHTPV